MSQAAPPDDWDLYLQLCRSLAGEPPDPASLPDLVALARQYHVEPALACRVGTQLRAVTPEAQQLKEALLQNTRRNMLVLAQALRLAQCLNRVGIQPLFLKGTARLLTAPGDQIGFRRQVDIDILLAPDEIRPGCAAMLGEGYRFITAAGARVPESVDDALQLGASHHHLAPLAHEDYDATVEVHTQPLPLRFSSLPGGDWWQRATGHELRGASFRVPALEHRAVMLALGDYSHDGYRARYQLSPRTLEDYLALQRAFADSGVSPDSDLLLRLGGRPLRELDTLVAHITGSPNGLVPAVNIERRLRLMQARTGSPRLAALLDQQARWRHLGLALRHNSGKLPAYLRRLTRRR